MLSYIPLVNRLLGTTTSSKPPARPPKEIKLDAVPVHRIETNPEKRPRTLKHLLRANHANHAVIYHGLRFDNHLPHLLCSAYLLDASPRQLHQLYDAEARELEPWPESPAEVSRDDWRAAWGDRRYQRAYLDFFEDQMALRMGYDWRRVVDAYLLGGPGADDDGDNDKDGNKPPPLVNGLIGGLGHPLIHLGYAFEMDQKEVAMEALALAATEHDFLSRYTDDPSYTRPPPPGGFRSASPLEILDRVARDARFDGLFEHRGFDNIEALFADHEDLVLEYWNAWTLGNTDDDGADADAVPPVQQFARSQEAAAALLVATVPPGAHSYNFFLVHVLTTSHAVRVLLPSLPARLHVPLVRQWWLLALAVYVAQLRPRVDPDYVGEPAPGGGKGWAYVERAAVDGRWRADAHFVKACRALREAARTWGDVHSRYLAAAVRFVDDFEGWTF